MREEQGHKLRLVAVLLAGPLAQLVGVEEQLRPPTRLVAVAGLLVVGLAPGLRGANRTGRPFTGDWAGDLLYATLGKFGFTRGTYDSRQQSSADYRSSCGVPVFRAPVNRTVAAWKQESVAHGWPSFRDAEVVWDNVRCLANGECVSLVGTHLGHNLPDSNGNRYCINLVSVSGNPALK